MVAELNFSDRYRRRHVCEVVAGETPPLLEAESERRAFMVKYCHCILQPFASRELTLLTSG